MEEESRKVGGGNKEDRNKTAQAALGLSPPNRSCVWRSCQDNADLPSAEPLVILCRLPGAAAMSQSPSAGCGEPLSKVTTSY